MEVELDVVGKRKLEQLNSALSNSKSSNKSTVALWARHVIFGASLWSDVEFEAMLLY